MIEPGQAEFEIRDLKIFAELGRALWADPGRSDPAMLETMSTIALQDFTRERALERASSALLNLARDQVAPAVLNQNHLFFSLPPEQRFVLAALHLGRWSYARLARVMGETPERIEELAWQARVWLATSRASLTPIGGRGGVHCPDYDLKRPWTQRFLDEEIKQGAERVFLQNHLMACASCQQAMNRCRDLYYAVERMLPTVDEAQDGIIGELHRICRKSSQLRFRGDGAFGRSLVSFAKLREVQILFAILAFALWQWARRH
jgi:hypothetical protein